MGCTGCDNTGAGGLVKQCSGDQREVFSFESEFDMKLVSLGIAVVVLSCSFSTCSQGEDSMLFKELEDFVAKREAEFDRIPQERKAALEQLAEYLRDCQSSATPARLIFVCTHNSRRSHMSQLWAAVAAFHYGIANVETFSGGTESTAFNPRAVAAMQRAGFRIEIGQAGTNPNYHASFAHDTKPQSCFSKVYSDTANPSEGFCAVMTCSSADKSCPSVKGAVARIAIPYEDPKIADDTPQESATYDERSAQICREILYAFSRSKQL
jgi:arsenate reductase